MSSFKYNGYSGGNRNNANKITAALIAAVVVIAVVLCVLVLLKSCSGSKKDNSSSDPALSTVSTATGDSGGIDPENIELDNGTGATVNTEDLYHENGRANGIDVSKWQGKIDWSAVKNSGIDFAVIRIGFRAENGKIYKDEYADYNLQQAQKAGLLTGVYFFSTAITTAEAAEEAQWTAAQIAGYPVSYPVVYDCEGFRSADSRMYGISNSARTDIALTFLNEMSKSGYETMLYAAQSELDGSAYWDTPRLESATMIFLARYTAVPYPKTTSPDYAGKYDMWQYTNMGQVAGVDGNVDLIVSYFTRSETAAKDAASQPAAVSAPSEDDKIYTAASDSVTAKVETNLRDAASTRGNIVATVKNGEFVTRTGVGSNGWSKLTYNGKTVYAITSYLTTDGNYTPPEQPKADVVNGNTFTAASGQVTAKDTLNLRSAPTTDSEVVATIKNGEFVTRTATSDKGWTRLNYNGQTVYAVTRFLTTEVNSPSSVQSSTADNSGTQFTDVNESVTAKEATNLHTEPTTSPETVVYTLKNGEYLTRTGVSQDGKWSRLDYNGQTVYAISSYLTN